MKYLSTHSCLLPLGLSAEAIAGLRMEIKLLSQLDHPNIVKLIEAFDTNESVSPLFKNRKHSLTRHHVAQTTMIMEICSGGELYDSLLGPCIETL